MKSSEFFNRRYTQQEVDEFIQKIRASLIPFELRTFDFTEATELLKVSERTLRELVSQRVISYVQLKERGKITFRAEHLKSFLEKYSVKSL